MLIKRANDTTRNIYRDGRGFIHYVSGDINIKLQVRLIGQALEFKVKNPSDVERLRRDIVLVPLCDLLALAQEIDKDA